jgi:hypothetical protein
MPTPSLERMEGEPRHPFARLGFWTAIAAAVGGTAMSLQTSPSTLVQRSSEAERFAGEHSIGRMEVRQRQQLGRLGVWAAIITAIGSLGFSLPALLQFSGLLTLSYLWDRLLSFALSLLLAVSFVVLMTCIHSYAVPEKKLWSQVGLAFAIAYMVLVSLVYCVQLITVVPVTLQGEANTVAFLAFGGTYKSFMSAIDTFGYGIQGLATLFAAPVFFRGRLERWIRGLFIVDGVLAPAFVLALFNGLFLFPALGWCVTIPVSAILLAVLFRRVERVA